MKREYKILVFWSLLLMILAMGIQGKKCSAEEKQISCSMTENGITYSYKVTDNWEGGYIAEFRIKNETLQDIDDWTIRMDYEDDIINIWNAGILAHDDMVYTIGNAGWNQRLEAGGEVSFGIQAEYTLKINTPKEFEFLEDYTGVEDDEISRDSSAYIELEADDFETEREYEDYLKENENTYADILQIPMKARSATGTVTLAKNGQQYTLKGLRKRAIQNFYVVSNYIYVTQKGPKEDEGSVYLSRCTLNGNTATYKDEMKLLGVGHGQTLEMYKYKGETYFLFACGVNNGNDNYWSTQIGRIQYKAGSVLKNKDIKRFTYLAYANKSSESFGKILRVDAALSSDKKTILIWKQSGDNKYKQQFSGFDFDTFNAVLSATNSNTVSFKGNSKMKKACTFTFDDRNKNLGLPTSIQGVEISNKSNGLHSIYICSGTENDKGKKLSISRFNSSGDKKSTITISHKFGKYMEVEGIHISGDNLYIGLCSRNDADKATQYIFAVPKSKLK